LIIGGAGYLGSILCRELLSRGYKVRVLDCLMYGDVGIKDLYDNTNFEFIKGDIRNIQNVMDSMNGVDAVIHLAAIVGDPASQIDEDKTIEINYLSTKIISWACRYYNIDKFIFASTCSVYGDSSQGMILTEESPTNPLSLYAKMKYKSEIGLLKESSKSFSPIILRMGTLYGVSPRMRFDLVINLFVIKAYIDKTLKIFGGQQERCFCHIKDAANAYINCLESDLDLVGNQIFNVASSNLKISDLGRIIVNNIKPTKLEIDDMLIDNRSYMTTSKKLIDRVKWNPMYDIEYFINNINPNDWIDYKNPIYDNYKYIKNGERN